MSKESAYFTVENLSDKHDIKRVKQGLDSLHGIISVSINDAKSRVTVDYDSTASDAEAIEKKLDSLGYRAFLDSTDNLLL